MIKDHLITGPMSEAAMPTRAALIKSLKQLWFTLRTLGLPLILRSARYSLEKTHAELKYAEPIKPRNELALWWQAFKERSKPWPTPPPFESFIKPGAVRNWRHQEATLILECDTNCLQIMALAPGLIRVGMNEAGIFSTPFSYAIQKPAVEWSPPPVTVAEQDDLILFTTAEVMVQIHKTNSHIDFLDRDGRPINLDAGGLGRHEGWIGLERRLPPAAPVFGLGERAFPLNLRGHRFRTWQRDPGGRYDLEDDPLYQTHPWFISLNQDRAFGLLFDNSYRSTFDMGHSHPERYRLTAPDGEMRYYFIYGPEIKTILAQLAELTGAMPLPPLWSLGLHQSRWSYKTEKEVKRVARQFRERQIPGDVIHLDIHYMRHYTCFTWHPRRFPHPREMTCDLRQAGFRLVAVVDPGMKADRFNDVAEKGLKQDVFLKYPDGKVFRGPVWPGDCYFPDFTDPTVRIWWGELHRPLVEAGVAGFWNDMNEPSLFGLGDGTMPEVVHHSFEGRQANHSQMHNTYGMQMARATREGVSALRPQRRPFVLSRSGFVGIQRYAAVWTGDNESSWEHLRLSVSMTLNLGLSGVAFVGPDIGGFFGAPSPELFARWIQAAALFPLCRIHTAAFTPDQTPWAYGPTVEAIAKEALELRYRLLPYLYTAFWQASQQGLPIVRPMVLEFQDDPQTYLLEDQFMVGDALLVAPVLTPETDSRPVYLPQGQAWVDYWTGQYHPGGQTLTVNAPLTRLPIFIKAGTVLPHWPPIQHTDQAKTLETLDLHLLVAPGQSMLYEDEGEGLAYQHGAYRQTQFICRPAKDRIVLTTRLQGEYAPPYGIISWTIRTPEPITPSAIVADGLPILDWSSGALPNSITFQAPIVQRLEIWL